MRWPLSIVSLRLLPNVLGNADSPVLDSFSTGLLEHPHYTRPANFNGLEVPEVLLSGNHAKIDNGVKNNRLSEHLNEEKTCLRDAPLTDHQQKLLAPIKQQRKNNRFALRLHAFCDTIYYVLLCEVHTDWCSAAKVRGA